MGLLDIFTELYLMRERVHKLELRVNMLEKKETQIMATLKEVLDDVAAEKTVDDSLIALTGSIKAQLDALLAGQLTPAQQAQVDAIFAGIEANKKAVGDAVIANTPAGPTT